MTLRWTGIKACYLRDLVPRVRGPGVYSFPHSRVYTHLPSVRMAGQGWNSSRFAVNRQHMIKLSRNLKSRLQTHQCALKLIITTDLRTSYFSEISRKERASEVKNDRFGTSESDFRRARGRNERSACCH